MAVKTFTGTVHKFVLHLDTRFVIDPQSIPPQIRDALCKRHNYWLDSKIGPNHTVAHYDTMRQGWRDMRYGTKVESYEDRTIAYDSDTDTLFWS